GRWCWRTHVVVNGDVGRARALAGRSGSRGGVFEGWATDGDWRRAAQVVGAERRIVAAWGAAGARVQRLAQRAHTGVRGGWNDAGERHGGELGEPVRAGVLVGAGAR